MKKFLALCLVCVMILSCLAGCSVLAAEEGTKDYTALPFYGQGGTQVYELGKYPNLQSFVRIDVNVKNNDVVISRPFVGGLGNDLDKIAASVKETMDSYPEGMRYLKIHGTARVFGMNPQATIYLDEGVDKLAAKFGAFMEKYYNLGGKLDGLILDLEYVGLSSYYLSNIVDKNATYLQQIVDDPHYLTEVRPLLEERGFKFHENPNQYAPEIFGVYDKSGAQYEESRAIWDRVMTIRLGQYQMESCCDPVWKYYPDALINDYQSVDMYSWSKMLGSAGGNRIVVGNVSNYSSYHSRPSKNMYDSDTQTYSNPTAYNNALYADTPFNMLKYDNNLFKTMYLDSHTNMISVCICAYDYSASRTGGIANTAYYPENIYHLGMLDPKPFRLYVYAKEYDTEEEYFYRLSVISEILSELTRVAGYSDRTPIVLPRNWNDSFVLSGMYAGGRNIWRITPDMSTGVTKESFKVEGEDPTFYINGQTVTFPGGKIIEDTQISQTGTCGYWVETASNVVPIITNEADRYVKYPAFQEGFEGYEAGTLLNYTLAMPAHAWEINDRSKENVVVEVDKTNSANQVLAVKGDVTFNNTKLVKNITAADSYAKRQAWELTFTMPETMGSDTVITLLKSNKDGGFKVTADKVYYDENGEYVELEKVKLDAGAKYTVKRVLDFNIKETTDKNGEVTEFFTSSYYIYDAEGKLVGSAENVAMKLFTLPVQKVGFTTENLGANTVYFDDLKMYAVGFADDLSLFEAEFGMPNEDLTAAYGGRTGYRYSWMNASDKEEKVQLVAQVLDAEGNVVSETVIKELTMLPGYDGVEMGIYDAKDTPVVFTVKTVTAPAKGGDILLYIGIGAAVVLIAVVAAVVIVIKKKPQTPTAE